MKVLIGEPKEIAAYERALKDGSSESKEVLSAKAKEFMALWNKVYPATDEPKYSTALDLDSAVRGAVKTAVDLQLDGKSLLKADKAEE